MFWGSSLGWMLGITLPLTDGHGLKEFIQILIHQSSQLDVAGHDLSFLALMSSNCRQIQKFGNQTVYHCCLANERQTASSVSVVPIFQGLATGPKETANPLWKTESSWGAHSFKNSSCFFGQHNHSATRDKEKKKKHEVRKEGGIISELRYFCKLTSVFPSLVYQTFQKLQLLDMFENQRVKIQHFLLIWC